MGWFKGMQQWLVSSAAGVAIAAAITVLGTGSAQAGSFVPSITASISGPQSTPLQDPFNVIGNSNCISVVAFGTSCTATFLINGIPFSTGPIFTTQFDPMVPGGAAADGDFNCVPQCDQLVIGLQVTATPFIGQPTTATAQNLVVSVLALPEPATLALLLSGFAGLAVGGRRVLRGRNA